MIIIFAILFGSALGSFSAAWANAWLNGGPFPRMRSVCDNCGKTLAFWQLIPVLNIFLTRGKCPECNHKFTLFYFWTELASAIICGLFAWRYGPGALTAIYMVIGVALVTASAIDIAKQLLPDLATLGCLAFLPCLAIWQPDFTWLASICGYLAGSAIPFLIGKAFQVLHKRESLGLGDIKLFGLAGALCGWQALPPIFLLSAIGGIAGFFCLIIHLALTGQKTANIWNTRMPFGPYICAAILTILLFPDMPRKFYIFVTAI